MLLCLFFSNGRDLCLSEDVWTDREMNTFRSEPFFNVRTKLVWKDCQKERNRAMMRSTGAIACPPTAPSVTGLSDSLMRFKMTGMWTPCCGKGELFLVLKIDGGRAWGVSGGGGCRFPPWGVLKHQ